MIHIIQTSSFFICMSFILVFILFKTVKGFSFLTVAPLILVYFIYMLILQLTISKRVQPMLLQTENDATLNRILYELLYKSVHSNNIEELYQNILESAIESIPIANKGCILLLNEETGLLYFVATKGYDMQLLKNTFLKLEQTYLYRESKGKIIRTVVIHDPFGYDRLNLHEENIDKILEAGNDNVMTTLSTPIIYNNKLHGMINIDSRFMDAYTPSDQTTIELFALEIVNVIKLYASMEELTYISNHDQLTKTYNRNYFNELLPQKLQLAQEQKQSISLVSIDLNGLKKSNDTYGHDCGDHLLSHFSHTLQKHLPFNSTFFRYGGDEFFLLLTGTTTEKADELLEELQSNIIHLPLHYGGWEIPLSFCYGISTFPFEQSDLDSLMRQADERMYIQKRQYHSDNP